MIIISTAKTPWGFILFFSFFFLFFYFKIRHPHPFISTGTQKQDKQNKSNFHWNNMLHSKNKKEGTTINNNEYIYLSFFEKEASF